MKSKLKYSRRQVVTALIDMLEAGMSVERVARVLAGYLVETRQTRNIELYLRDIELALTERLGVATAHVYSAKKLNGEVRKKIQQLVAEAYKVKKVEMIENIELSLIGGVVVKTADAELDGTVLTKLQSLRSI